MASSEFAGSPILEEAFAAAQRAGVELSPDVVAYLNSKYPAHRDNLVPLSLARDVSMRRNTAHLILEAAALSGGTGGELQLNTVKSALAGLCQRYPDFWPFCPP